MKMQRADLQIGAVLVKTPLCLIFTLAQALARLQIIIFSLEKAKHG